MTLSPNDWLIHVRSTRDLADRMLVRGDTKEAEAMMKATVELEKRYHTAMEIARYAAISINTVGGSSLETLPLVVDGRAARAGFVTLTGSRASGSQLRISLWLLSAITSLVSLFDRQTVFVVRPGSAVAPRTTALTIGRRPPP
jgi:hypothetical protein